MIRFVGSYHDGVVRLTVSRWLSYLNAQAAAARVQAMRSVEG